VKQWILYLFYNDALCYGLSSPFGVRLNIWFLTLKWFLLGSKLDKIGTLGDQK